MRLSFNNYSVPTVFALLVIFIMIISCKKDPPVVTQPPTNFPDCITIGSPPWGSMFWEAEAVGRQFQMPCFNPQNSNEFLYCNGSGLNDSIFKYNLITQTSTLILSGQDLFSRPYWGKNDWIVFSSNGPNIWKVKSSGDSLTQLTFDSGNYFPGWNYDYTAIVYYRYAPLASYTMTIDGAPLDTIGDCYGSTSTWNHPQYIASINYQHATICNPLTGERTNIADMPDPSHSIGIAITFIDNETVMWSYSDGLYSTNIYSKETQYIIDTCNSTMYLYPSYSPQANKILWQKFERTPDSAYTKLFVRNFIAIMNPDGTEEEELPLP
jgi:hypothetical protein